MASADRRPLTRPDLNSHTSANFTEPPTQLLKLVRKGHREVAVGHVYIDALVQRRRR